MAARGSGREVLSLGPHLLHFLNLFQLVAGRWGPASAGGGVPRGEPGQRKVVPGVRPPSRWQDARRLGWRRAGAAGLPGQLHAGASRAAGLSVEPKTLFRKAVKIFSWGLGLRFQFKWSDILKCREKATSTFVP